MFFVIWGVRSVLGRLCYAQMVGVSSASSLCFAFCKLQNERSVVPPFQWRGTIQFEIATCKPHFTVSISSNWHVYVLFDGGDWSNNKKKKSWQNQDVFLYDNHGRIWVINSFIINRANIPTRRHIDAYEKWHVWNPV